MRAEAGTSANTFRVYSFSYLRAAACLAIVLLHTVFCAVSLFRRKHLLRKRSSPTSSSTT